MKKIFILGLLINMLLVGTAYADILPQGKTVVPVCAYFNNTAEFLDTISIFGFETGPGGNRIDLSQYIADECFHTSYKFNGFGVYAVTVEHAATLDLDTYDPKSDEEAYPTNIMPEIGDMLVDEDDALESVANEYAIIELDLENEVLVIEPVKTIKYFSDGSDPEVIEGSITSVSGGIGNEENGEDIFTDVSSDSEYFDALKYLKDRGIIEGYPDGSFKPGITINRAEFTKIVVGSITTDDALSACAANYTVEDDYNVTLFSDVVFAMVGGNEPEWYFDFVCVAKLNGIIGGYPDGSFMPAQDINFVEGAKIVTEAVGYQMMTDLEPWYMGYVKELGNHNAIPTSIASFDQKLTRGEMAEIMYRLMADVTDLESLTYEDLL